MPKVMDNRRLVTVCDECLCASCWHGEFMCQQATDAGTVELPVRTLQWSPRSFAVPDVFLTESAARTQAEGKKEELERDQRTRAECIKKNVHKSFSWNASYHLREAKRHRKDALRHDEKAQLCKERVKE